MKQTIKKILHSIGYDLQQIERSSSPKNVPAKPPTPIKPIWPLPIHPHAPSVQEIQKEFAKYELWHYPYEFENGLSFLPKHDDASKYTNDPKRPFQRFNHFMPYLVDAQGDKSLKGKRVLDIACNSGFWGIQCALMGAEVVGFDARQELIDQANLIKSIVNLDNISFQVLDFWDMSPDLLGKFDIVLSLGILYHLPNPLEALRLTVAMTDKHILLDTGIDHSKLPIIRMIWEEPTDIRMAHHAGIVAFPSKSGLDLMLQHLGCHKWFEVPLRTDDMPHIYRIHRRASWVIQVKK